MQKGVKFHIVNKSYIAILLAVTAAAPAAALDRSVIQAANLPAAENPITRSIVRSGNTVTGTSDGLTWTAANRIVGVTPTADASPAGPLPNPMLPAGPGNRPNPPANNVGGGDVIYKPSASKSGVVALIMQTPDGAFICSGSLLNGGRHIATAAHCVAGSDGLRNATSTTAYFFNGNSDQRTPFGPGVAIDVSHYFINPGYTGEVIDQNDIAVLRLGALAPMQFERYSLFTPTSLTGTGVNVAGYGTRSISGGTLGTGAGAGAGTGYLREGDNIFDYAFGNSLFQGFFTTRDVGGAFDGQNFFGFAEVEKSYISDFDNGVRAVSQSRRLANALGLGPIGNANFDNSGVGAREIGIAGGDSGGPGFVNGKLASINSYGLTFGLGDVTPGLDNSFGELSGYVPVYIHKNFIVSSQLAAIPEPSSWAMLIAGFGLVGASLRRRRSVAA
ncbi:trypsin-like serine protease [Sandarakinorhabdus sp.]|uniref:trypsin-like serine protease n=1 Tax=Sandarakinorhabdus sp. TaxID=1916663 RepID=UPI0033410F5D